MKTERYEVHGGHVDIIVLAHDDQQLPTLLNPFKREKGMSWGNPDGTQWVFALLDGQPVGVVALSTMTNGTLRFKSDVVLAFARMRGIYAALCRHRLKLADETGASKASTYAGDKSEPQYTKDGFKVQSRKDGVAYMVKAL